MPNNFIYEYLGIAQYEEKGLMYETYATKLAYYGLVGGLIGGITSRFMLRRFNYGFFFGVGYGAGLVNTDLSNLFKFATGRKEDKVLVKAKVIDQKDLVKEIVVKKEVSDLPKETETKESLTSKTKQELPKQENQETKMLDTKKNL